MHHFDICLNPIFVLQTQYLLLTFIASFSTFAFLCKFSDISTDLAGQGQSEYQPLWKKKKLLMSFTHTHIYTYTHIHTYIYERECIYNVYECLSQDEIGKGNTQNSMCFSETIYKYSFPSDTSNIHYLENIVQILICLSSKNLTRKHALLRIPA